MAALFRKVDSLRRKELGRLAGGLLRRNRPLSPSWYKGRGGEQKNLTVSVRVEAADGGRGEAARVGHRERVGQTLSRCADFFRATWR